MAEPYRQKDLPPRERAEDLAGRMNLREKVGQLNQRLNGFSAYERKGDQIRLTEDFTAEVDRWAGLGLLYGLNRADPRTGRDFSNGLPGVLAVRTRNMIQRYVREHSRFGIPVLFSEESSHGPLVLDGCLLPVNLAVGCSFHPALLEQAAAVIGEQLRSLGVDLVLVSMLDVLRDPRWGRSEECFGEDPFLSARMAEAVVRAIQSRGVDVVARHLGALGETTGGVNTSAARIGPRELRDIHLPPAEAAVKAGVSGVMAAPNEIDGICCHANQALLRDLLRKEYGFGGFVMSASEAVDRLDALTGGPAASGALAVRSGVDVGLRDQGFAHLEEAVEQGLLKESTLDEAVVRVLTVKFRRGLFEEPFVPETELWRGFTPDRCPPVKALAEESLVLLKNRNHLLPLSMEKPLRVGLIGPAAVDLYAQLGDYTPPVQPQSGITVCQGLSALLAGTPARIFYKPGFDRFGPGLEEKAVRSFAKAQDVLIAAVGGTSSRYGSQASAKSSALAEVLPDRDCGEGADDGRDCLPGRQIRLLELLRESGKPVITLLLAGRPYEMADIDRCSDAILCAFYPGLTGGEAIAKVLFGAAEPAGRLSVSLPDRASQIPVYYNAKPSSSPAHYYNIPEPRFTFGCGESYTNFSFTLLSGPTTEKQEVSFAVTNTGSRLGWSVPQLYIHRLQGLTVPRIRQLCGFEKFFLHPGECRHVTLSIPPESLRQWDESLHSCLPAGTIEWLLCDSGEVLLRGEFPVL